MSNSQGHRETNSRGEGHGGHKIALNMLRYNVLPNIDMFCMQCEGDLAKALSLLYDVPDNQDGLAAMASKPSVGPDGEIDEKISEWVRLKGDLISLLLSLKKTVGSAELLIKKPIRTQIRALSHTNS